MTYVDQKFNISVTALFMLKKKEEQNCCQRRACFCLQIPHTSIKIALLITLNSSRQSYIEDFKISKKIKGGPLCPFHNHLLRKRMSFSHLICSVVLK